MEDSLVRPDVSVACRLRLAIWRSELAEIKGYLKFKIRTLPTSLAWRSENSGVMSLVDAKVSAGKTLLGINHCGDRNENICNISCESIIVVGSSPGFPRRH